MAYKTDHARLVDLKAKIKKIKPDQMMSTDDCCAMWGVSKPRWTNKMREFSYFPDPQRDGIRYLYPAREAIKAMIDHLEHRQQAQSERAKRTAGILGGGTAFEEHLAHYTPSEIVSLNRIQSDISERERDQGLYAPVSEITAIAGAVFSMISDFMSGLSNAIDPHGKLDPAMRKMIDTKAHARLLEMHSHMKGLLTEDAVDRTTRTKAGRASASRTRRKR